MAKKLLINLAGIEKMLKFALLNLEYAIIAQLVEHQLPKLRVAGSSPVYRSDVKLIGSQCCYWEPIF